MGRKSSAKSQGGVRPPSPPKRSSNRATIAIVVTVVAVGAFMYLRQESADAPVASTTQSPASASKPHVQETLPPLNFPPYGLQRPNEVIRAAYRFAGEHPEVLSYVPCFCGCEAGGHSANHDCFVGQRAGNGDVVAWTEHGFDCTLCIDIATRSRQLFEQGKSVADIRVAIEREWGGRTMNKTPTPPVPRSN